MNLELRPFSPKQAKDFFEAMHQSPEKLEFDFAVGVCSEDSETRGVIAMKADGATCELAHLFTDGTALVGSLLYGAAWRAAKALGYKSVTL